MPSMVLPGKTTSLGLTTDLDARTNLVAYLRIATSTADLYTTRLVVAARPPGRPWRLQLWTSKVDKY